MSTPSSISGATPTTYTPATLVDQALHTFERAVGGRDTLIAAFASGAGAVDPEQQLAIDRLLTLLADPAAGDKSLGQLARAAKLSMPELVRLYKDARIAYAHVEAIEVIARKIPGVVADVMAQALPTQAGCPACEGRRVVIVPPRGKQTAPTQVDCPTCKGTGSVAVRPSLAVQKVALALAGLLQGPQSMVALTVNNTNSTSTTTNTLSHVVQTFSKMQAASDQILYGQTKPIGGSSTAAAASTFTTPAAAPARPGPSPSDTPTP